MRALTLRPPTDQEWDVINKLAASRPAPAAQVRRAQLLKHLSQGVSAPQATALVGGLTAETARNVFKSFNQEGLKVLEDKPRSGRPPRISEVERGRLVMLTQSPPPEGPTESSGACHWKVATLLAAAHQEGIPIGRAVGWSVLIRPPPPEKGDIVGLYTHPPEGSTVNCVDEKGPVAAKLYPAQGQWAEASHRPHYQPDYGRSGYL
jgi:transposase